MFEKHIWKSDILSKDAGLWHAFFKHFDSKNQWPGFYIKGTLVENGLFLFYNWNAENGNAKVKWIRYLAWNISN